MIYSKVIVQKDGRGPLSNARVCLSIDGILTGGVTATVRTNNNGVATIPHSASGTAKIIVDGTIVDKMQVPGEHLVFIR